MRNPAEAAELKQWCGKEICESTAKKEEADALFGKLTTKFNKASSRSKQLKEEVATLQKELAELASTQGAKLALKILNGYYARADKSHGSSDEAVASSACLR